MKYLKSIFESKLEKSFVVGTIEDLFDMYIIDHYPNIYIKKCEDYTQYEEHMRNHRENPFYCISLQNISSNKSHYYTFSKKEIFRVEISINRGNKFRKREFNSQMTLLKNRINSIFKKHFVKVSAYGHSYRNSISYDCYYLTVLFVNDDIIN